MRVGTSCEFKCWSLTAVLSAGLCRRRRIKCDEEHPCQSCLTSNSACTFEELGKRTRPHKFKYVLVLSISTRCTHSSRSFQNRLPAAHGNLKDTRRHVMARISRPHPAVLYLLIIVHCLSLVAAVRRMLPDCGDWQMLCRSELMLVVAETAGPAAGSVDRVNGLCANQC